MGAQLNQQFIFSNKIEDLYGLQSAIISQLAISVDLDDALTFKLKVVLTELLTNAIKHAGCSESVIEAIVQDDAIVIIKSDTGNSFSGWLEGSKYDWPLPGRHFGNKVMGLYGDDNCTLSAKTENNFTLNFFIEEREGGHEADDIKNLSEHFGLMIIARACDSFSYVFDVDLCSNNFIASFKR